MDSPDQPRRVTLELDDDLDAIHGTLEHIDGTRQRFWGWLDLMSAIERIPRTSQPQGTPRAQSPETR
jgi:hypothetical protein